MSDEKYVKVDQPHFLNQLVVRVFSDEDVAGLLKGVGNLPKAAHRLTEKDFKKEVIYYADVSKKSAFLWHLEKLAVRKFSALAKLAPRQPHYKREQNYKRIRKKTLSLCKDLLAFGSIRTQEPVFALTRFVEAEDKSQMLVRALLPKQPGKRIRTKTTKREFVEGLFFIWKHILEKEVRISRSIGEKNEGMVTGPLLRFVQATLAVVGENIEPETLADWVNAYKKKWGNSR